MIHRESSNKTIEIFSFHAWREQFLRLIMRGAVIFGPVALIPSLLANRNPVILALYSAAYLALLIATFARLSYSFRAWSFISLFYVLGIGGLYETGIWANARVFFVVTALITSMLISPRAGIWTAALTLLTIAIGGWLILGSHMQITTLNMWPGDMTTWIRGGALIILLDAIFILGIDLLMKEFLRAQDRASRSLKELDAERRLLEERVASRTRDSLRKTAQLEAASYVARKITGTHDLPALLNDIVRTVSEQFKFYHVGIFMLDQGSQNAILQAASSEGGARMLEAGHRLKAGDQGIVGFVTGKGLPRIALDVGSDEFFLKNPFLPLTRSEMTIPLIARQRVIGALDIQSDLPQAFSEGDLEVMQALASQLATAIENARLLSESEAAIAQFESVNSLLVPQLWGRFLRGRNHAFQYKPTGLHPYDGSEPITNTGTLHIPLVLRGREIGMIHLHRKPAAPMWGARERIVAEEVAAQVALALDNARLLEETTHRAEVERLTSDISARIGSSSLYESIIKTAAEELSRALGGSDVLVQIQPPQPSASGNGHKGGFEA